MQSHAFRPPTLSSRKSNAVLGHTFLPKSVFSRTCPGAAHKVPFREKHCCKTTLLMEQRTKYEFGMQTLWLPWARGSSSLRNPSNSQPLPRTLLLCEPQCHPRLPQQSQLDPPCGHRTPPCQGKKVPGPGTRASEWGRVVDSPVFHCSPG